MQEGDGQFPALTPTVHSKGELAKEDSKSQLQVCGSGCHQTRTKSSLQMPPYRSNVFHNVHEVSPSDPYGSFRLGNLAVVDTYELMRPVVGKMLPTRRKDCDICQMASKCFKV